MRKNILFTALLLATQSTFANPPDNTFVACDEQKINCLALQKEGFSGDRNRYGYGVISYYYTNDGGNQWQTSEKTSPCPLPNLYWWFNHFVCSKDAIHCVAVGFYQMSKHGYGTYFTIVTNDRGMKWSYTWIPTPDDCGHMYPDGGETIYEMTCSENGLSCQAIGGCAYHGDINQWRKFSSSSQDGGVTWSRGVFI